MIWRLLSLRCFSIWSLTGCVVLNCCVSFVICSWTPLLDSIYVLCLYYRFVSCIFYSYMSKIYRNNWKLGFAATILLHIIFNCLALAALMILNNLSGNQWVHFDDHLLFSWLLSLCQHPPITLQEGERTPQSFLRFFCMIIIAIEKNRVKKPKTKIPLPILVLLSINLMIQMLSITTLIANEIAARMMSPLLKLCFITQIQSI